MATAQTAHAVGEAFFLDGEMEPLREDPARAAEGPVLGSGAEESRGILPSGSAVESTRPPVAAGPSRVAAPQEQLLEAVLNRNEDGAELVLAPEELGRVQFGIHRLDGNTTITVLVDRPETLRLMRLHGDWLMAELAAAGMPQADISFAGRQDRRATHWLKPRGSDEVATAPFNNSAAPTRGVPARQPGNHIDLRL